MASQSPWIIEVTDASFDRDVVARSREVPVLVDFWAPWCGPCRMLGPVLERLAVELGGDFVLAKLNTDENVGVAGRYGISGIPDVRLFRGGEVVDQFVGALPEPHVRAFLRKHIPSKLDLAVAEGDQALAAGDVAAARAAYQRVLDMSGEHAGAHLALARLALREGDREALARHVEAISYAADEREAADHLLHAGALLAKAEAVGSRQEVAARVEAAPEDLTGRFAHGAYALADGHPRTALEDFLAVAERDRKWEDEAARKAMLTVFGIIGVRHPLSDEFRKKLMFVY